MSLDNIIPYDRLRKTMEKISFIERRGELNCSLCKSVHKKAKENPTKEFINCHVWSGIKYKEGGFVF